MADRSPDEEQFVFGVTHDYAWNELMSMKKQLLELANRCENLEETLKARSNEVSNYVQYLESKVRMLKELVPQEAKE